MTKIATQFAAVAVLSTAFFSQKPLHAAELGIPNDRASMLSQNDGKSFLPATDRNLLNHQLDKEVPTITAKAEPDVIKAWQRALNFLGGDVAVTGKLDADTKEQTKDLQKKLKLLEDGKPGKTTIKAALRGVENKEFGDPIDRQ